MHCSCVSLRCFFKSAYVHAYASISIKTFMQSDWNFNCGAIFVTINWLRWVTLGIEWFSLTSRFYYLNQLKLIVVVYFLNDLFFVWDSKFRVFNLFCFKRFQCFWNCNGRLKKFVIYSQKFLFVLNEMVEWPIARHTTPKKRLITRCAVIDRLLAKWLKMNCTYLYLIYNILFN